MPGALTRAVYTNINGSKMRSIADFLINLIKQLFGLLADIAGRLLDRFFEFSIFEKAIVLNSIPAFLAVVMPVAHYHIFDYWKEIYNPLSVHLIGIVLLMIVTIFMPVMFSLVLRLGVNILYITWTIYLHLSGEISHAPYQLMGWYYLNLVVPSLYIIFSFFSFRRER